MHNGQIGIRDNTFENDLVANGITAGVGNRPADENPDHEQSITFDALRNKPDAQDSHNVSEENSPEETLAQIQLITNTATPQHNSIQPKPDRAKNEKLSSITISGGNLDLKYALEIQNTANDMLNKKDAAGFVDAIRDENYGAVTMTLKNSFGDKSVLEQSE